MNDQTALYSHRVVVDGRIQPATIVMRRGVIAAIESAYRVDAVDVSRPQSFPAQWILMCI